MKNLASVGFDVEPTLIMNGSQRKGNYSSAKRMTILFLSERLDKYQISKLLGHRCQNTVMNTMVHFETQLKTNKKLMNKFSKCCQTVGVDPDFRKEVGK